MIIVMLGLVLANISFCASLTAENYLAADTKAYRNQTWVTRVLFVLICIFCVTLLVMATEQ